MCYPLSLYALPLSPLCTHTVQPRRDLGDGCASHTPHAAWRDALSFVEPGTCPHILQYTGSTPCNLLSHYLLSSLLATYCNKP